VRALGGGPIERCVAPTIEGQCVAAGALVVPGHQLFVDDPDRVRPPFLPYGLKPFERLFLGQHAATEPETVELLERLVHAGPQERLDRVHPFDVGFANVLVPVLPWAVLEGT
jgi:hypothetical protein